MIIWYDSKFGNMMAMMAMWGLVFISMSNNELYDTIQMLLFDHITCLLILVSNIIRVTMTYICIYIHIHMYIHICIMAFT